MQYLQNGKVMFDDIYELYYHLFTEMGLSINGDQYLYDQDTMTVLRYKDKFIKATVQPIEIYSGISDIIFDPARNYNLMITLFGYFLDKESSNIGFCAQYIDDYMDKQRLIIKTSKGDICSSFYNNLYLAYIECIFKLTDSLDVDLSNFDVAIF